MINLSPRISERPGTAGQDRYYNDDALGSATDLTDLNGNILSTRKWDAFGNMSGTSTYFRGWNEGSGYEEDSASGLKLLGYRYYDPTIGRFLTPDPIGDGSNWYAYCGNNPVGFTDPNGLARRSIFGDGAFDDDRRGGLGEDNGFFDKKNPVYNFMIGFDDGCSLGITKIARAHMGTASEVDMDNGWYFAGEVTGEAVSSYLTGAGAGKVFNWAMKGKKLKLFGPSKSKHLIRIEYGNVHVISGMPSTSVKVLHLHIMKKINIGKDVYDVGKLHLHYQLWPYLVFGETVWKVSGDITEQTFSGS